MNDKPPTARKKTGKATGKHWRIETDDEGIAWLHFDRAKSSTNTLSSAVLAELGQRLDALGEAAPKGLVFLSDKPNGFIAGADVSEFTTLRDAETATELVRQGQGIINRIEALNFPTVALIHGFCLGGGLELALACRYRVVEDDPATRLGLPEVRLGIHPGFGGTVRLPRLIGVPAAMDLILSGRTVSARGAKKLGLADHAVPRRHLRRAARSLVLRPPAVRRPGKLISLAGHRLVRPWLARYLRQKTAERVSQRHYPAPFAVIDLWAQHGDDPQAMLAEEVKSISRLIVGYTARNLIRVFFLQETLKAQGKTKAGNKRAPVERVHVIGGGVMGGDIAAWCALRGLRVTVQDQNPEALSRVVKRAHGLFRKKLKQPRVVQAAMDRLMPDLKGDGLAGADVVIEAIFENLEAKQKLFRAIEPRLKAGALLATNTSSIPLEELDQALKRPGRLVGLHFFNPVAKMQLVEIVAGSRTNKTDAARAAAFTRSISRLPLPVRSGPGFLVNRILMPYLMEAVILEEEGVPAPAVDKAAVDFGMPMGPIHLADTVGLDICLSVAENLAQHLGAEVPEKLRKLVKAGYLGRKSGRGFYHYQNDKPRKDKPPKDYRPPADLTDRMMLRMLNEAVACLREGVVAKEDLLDAGVVFGTGFAPFHGGPVHYLRHAGVDTLKRRLQELEENYGARFKPDPGWETLAG